MSKIRSANTRYVRKQIVLCFFCFIVFFNLSSCAKESSKTDNQPEVVQSEKPSESENTEVIQNEKLKEVLDIFSTEENMGFDYMCHHKVSGTRTHYYVLFDYDREVLCWIVTKTGKSGELKSVSAKTHQIEGNIETGCVQIDDNYYHKFLYDEDSQTVKVFNQAETEIDEFKVGNIETGIDYLLRVIRKTTREKELIKVLLPEESD